MMNRLGLNLVSKRLSSSAAAAPADSTSSPAQTGRTLRIWNMVKGYSFGPALFAVLIRYIAPYSASVSPRVRELREGYCRADITERWRLKNPFNSVHAVALTNIGELSSGLCVMSALDNSDTQGIVKTLGTEYFKKAKGTITAVAEVDLAKIRLPPGQDQGTVEVYTNLYNGNKELVAKTTAVWTLRRKGTGKK